MNINLCDNLSRLTTIDKDSLDKLLEKFIWCISDAVENAQLKNDNYIDIDLHIGHLIITILESEIKYKFKPSDDLDNSIVNTVVNERNDLVLNIEKNLVNKFKNIYKDMF